MKDRIWGLIQQLNRKEILPQIYQRRNSIHYSFLSYINNSIGCYISENYDSTILFLNRAYKELEKLNSRNDCDYLLLCNNYMKATSEYLVRENLIDEFSTGLVKNMDFESLFK